MLVLCMLLTMVVPCFAATETKLNTEVTILNGTSIFSGLSLDFKSGKGKLLRSEAAVIFARLMGKESDISLNKGKFIDYSIKDVKAIAFEAPYIGYAIQQKAMSTEKAGVFNPSAVISEKEFLGLLAKVLEYTDKTELSTENILKTSFNAGIVKNEQYKTKLRNNYSYNRIDAITAVYNAIKSVKKNSGNTLASDLIKYNLVKRDYALKNGLLADATPTQISELNVISNTQIILKLNEPVKQIADKNIAVYGKGETTNIFSSVAEITDKSITINTSGQLPDKQYVVELTNVEDKDGFILNKVSNEFIGYKNYEIVSDFFKISKIEVESKSVINVFFTQPINSNAEVAYNYEILKGTDSYIKGSFDTLIPRVKKKYKNCISLYLREKDLVSGDAYTLKINGEVQSAYGLRLNDGSGDSMKFTGKTGENKAFDVVSVNAYDTRTVIVEYNRDVDVNSAASISNYSIVGSNGVPNGVLYAIVSSDGEGKNVKLGLASNLDKNLTYSITINNVYDAYRQTISNVVKYPFSGNTIAREKIGIVSVMPIDKGTISVYFDRPLDPTSAMMANNYSVSGCVVNSVSYDFNDPYAVKLFLASDSLSSSSSYTLTVFNTLKDESCNMFTSNATYSFNGTNNENLKPMMYDARIIGNNTIMVKLSEDIRSNGINTVGSNYYLEYKDGSNTKTKTATSAGLYDPTTLLIRFDSVSNGSQYVLKFNSLTDFTSNNIRVGGDDMSRISVSDGR